MSKPTIIVSSTCYDLQQVRADLREFLSDQLGYNPLLSEYSSFPVDPDIDTVENCRKRVEKDADIMVLIIGGRYGSLDLKSEKSITNLEFLEAQRKGIPIYVFVDKQVLAVLPVWEKNPAADFSTVVDTPRLFEFLQDVRSKQHVWTFPFETAQDIIAVLQIQFAYLFFDSLRIRARVRGVGSPVSYEHLSPKALRLALEKPDAWEYQLFYQCWLDELESRQALVREYEANLLIGESESVSSDAATGWFETRFKELGNLIESAGKLVNNSALEAFGLPGQPGDAEAIIWCSRALGRVVEHLIRWTLRIRRARVAPPFEEIAFHVSQFAADSILQLQEIPYKFLGELQEALAEPGPVAISRTFTFDLGDLEPFNEALEAAERKLERGNRNLK